MQLTAEQTKAFNDLYGYREGDKLEGDDLLIRTARLDAWAECLKHIQTLAKNNPNDFSLGGEIRRMVSHPTPALTPDPARTVEVLYTNWKGIKEWRTIIPLGVIQYMEVVWHPEPQWCILVHAVDRNEERVFVLKDIHEWKPKTVLSEVARAYQIPEHYLTGAPKTAKEVELTIKAPTFKDHPGHNID